MLRTVITVCGILLGILAAAILVAWSREGIWEGLWQLLRDPWGLVVMLDLSVGLLFVAVWMAVIIPDRRAAAVWIMALLLLGNVVTLVFLLCRTRSVNSLTELFLPSDAVSHRSD